MMTKPDRRSQRQQPHNRHGLFIRQSDADALYGSERPRKKYSKPTVRRMARVFVAAGYAPFRRAILKDFGNVENVSDLKPWSYERVARHIELEAEGLGTDLNATARR